MKRFDLEKFSASACVAAAILSFVAVVDVHADPVFPPNHRAATADFGHATEKSHADVAGPWYFQGRATRHEIFRIESEDVSGSPRIAGTTEIEPWYRAAN